MLGVRVLVVVVVLVFSLAAAGASPPQSTAQTFGVNQQRSGLAPILGITSVSRLDSSSIRAITSPAYSNESDFVVVTYTLTGTSLYTCSCTARKGGVYRTVELPQALQFPYAANVIGIASLSSDDRAYVVASSNYKSFMLAYSHSCDLQYALELPASGGSLSPVVLADNSVVIGVANQVRVVANASDPIGGVPLWNTTLDASARSIGLALSVDNSTGVLFVSYSTQSGRYQAAIEALAPLRSGVVGFSPLWAQRVDLPSQAVYCGGSAFCSLTPVLCGSQVLLTTPTAVLAFDQATGIQKWSFGGSFPGAYHQPACHPSGMIVVIDGTATLVAFHAVGTSISEMWRRSTGAFDVVRAPVIDAAGSVYVIGGAATAGDANGAKLFAFDYKGNLLFARSTNVPPNAATTPQYMSQPVLLRDRIVVAVGDLVSYFP